MIQYTLEELNLIFDSKHYLTKDRFMHYFTTLYGYTEKEANEYFKIYWKFPIGLYEEKMITDCDIIIPKVLELFKLINQRQHLPYQFLSDNQNDFRKLIYIENEIIIECEINMCIALDIIAYAEILKRGVEIKACLSLCSEPYVDGKNIRIYEGEIYDTNDKYYGNKSRVFLAGTHDTYQQLLYIKGKGYMINNKPNIDKYSKYNHNCVTMGNYIKIGNIYVDDSVLYDSIIEK